MIGLRVSSRNPSGRLSEELSPGNLVGRTVKRHKIQVSPSPNRQTMETEANRTELVEMKHYISKIEGVLNEMKDWVSKKEKSTGSKGSFHSRQSRHQVNASKRSQRSNMPPKKVFFGETSFRQEVPEVSIDSQLEKNLQNKLDSKAMPAHPQQALGMYIKDCFMLKLKQRMMPSQAGAPLRRVPSGSGFGKLSGKFTGPGINQQEQIDYLTPVKNSPLKKSTANILMGAKVGQGRIERRLASLHYLEEEEQLTQDLDRGHDRRHRIV